MPLQGYWWAGRENAILTEPTPSREKCLKTRRIPTCLLHPVLGAFCLSQCTHKRTLPRNANQMKNTTKPNSFLAGATIRGYTFDTNIHTPFRPPRLAPERKGRFQVFFGGKFCYQFYFLMRWKCNNHPASEVVIKWNFPAVMPPLPWLKKH